MLAETTPQNMLEITSEQWQQKLVNIFLAQVDSDINIQRGNIRKSYNAIPCLETAIHHLIKLSPGTNGDDLFGGIPNRSVMSVGGIEAAAFLHLGATDATIYENSSDPRILLDHTNIEFIPGRFEPHTVNEKKYGLVIGSMIFDSGSRLVGEMWNLDIDDYKKRHRLKHLDADSEREKLAHEYGIPESDISFGYTKERDVVYRMYAKAMWELVDEGGVMIIDGSQAVIAASSLENNEILGFYNHKYHDKAYRILVMRKILGG